MPAFITETWLREHFTLTPGTEVQLPADGKLTPAARALLAERHIPVRFVDEQGRTFTEVVGHGEEPERHRVHPLTGSDDHAKPACLMCGQQVGRKPEALTHLDGHTLVAKNSPRLKLRGKLDTAIAHAVWVQSELSEAERQSTLGGWLSDVRSALGTALRCEVTGEPMAPVRMGDLDDEAIHRLSHDPLRYFGHDHLVPEQSQGPTLARLNLLRAQIREAELAAADVYIDREFNVLRPDLLQALNRLSSAVYVLMLLSHVAALGQAPDMQKLASWT